MKIKTDTFYIRRDGQVEGPLMIRTAGITRNQYPWISSQGRTFTNDGRFDFDKDTIADLIAPVSTREAPARPAATRGEVMVLEPTDGIDGPDSFCDCPACRDARDQPLTLIERIRRIEYELGLDDDF